MSFGVAVEYIPPDGQACASPSTFLKELNVIKIQQKQRQTKRKLSILCLAILFLTNKGENNMKINTTMGQTPKEKIICL